MSYSRKGSIIPIVLVTGIGIGYWQYAQYVVGAAMLYLIVKAILKTYKFGRSFMSVDIDSMDGITFEHYIADVLKNQGYINVSLTEQYDYGVDIVAEKNGVRWGIQVKRHNGLVKAAAVRQVVTGLRLYGCDRGMVITNSTFSNVAKRLARGNDCVLVDRADLDQFTR